MAQPLLRAGLTALVGRPFFSYPAGKILPDRTAQRAGRAGPGGWLAGGWRGGAGPGMWRG